MSTKFTITFIVLLLFSCTDNPIKGKNLSQLGFYSSPDTIINELLDSRDNYQAQFMLGLAYKEKKDLKKSILHFANSCFKSHRDFKLRLFPYPVYNFMTGFHSKSPLYDDALYEVANLFYQYREYDSVVKFINEIPEKHSGLYRNAVILKSRALSEQKKYSEAIQSLEKLINIYSDNYSIHLIRIRIGSLYEKSADFSNAIKEYLKILLGNSARWQSNVAVKRILAILPQSGYTLNQEEIITVGKSLFHAKEYDESIALFKSASPQKEYKQIIDAYYIRNYARKKTYSKAESVIKSIPDTSPDHYGYLKIYADELWSMRNKAKAIPIYNQIIAKGSGELKKDALKKTSVYMEERKIRGFEQYLTEYKNSYEDETSEYFLWLLGRNSIKQKNLSEAQKNLAESLNKYPQGKYSDRCRFWLYKIDRELGKSDDADNYAKELVFYNPDSSYCWLLLKRLNSEYTTQSLKEKYNGAQDNKLQRDIIFYHTLLFLNEKSMPKRTKRLADIDNPDIDKFQKLQDDILSMDVSSGNSSLLQEIEKYFAIGCTSAINRELKLISNEEEDLADRHIALASLGKKYGNSFYTIFSYLELLKLKGLRENISLMPEDSVKMLFPMPFGACVDSLSKQYSVPKIIIYSVIKAESLFNHSAVSSAGARGLMQLMPATARGLARELKIKDYNLNDPCTSIHFGTKYLAWLNKYFDNNFEFIVAGYNAGAGTINKWKKKFNTDDMDYLIEFTPYIETRYYIMRTGKFLDQYSAIYGD